MLLGENEETLSHMSLINSPSTSPKLIAKEEKQGDKVKLVLVLYWYVYRENYNTHFIDKVKKKSGFEFHIPLQSISQLHNPPFTVSF